MLDLEYVGQNIVENMIGVKTTDKIVKENSAIIITFEYNFMEWFKNDTLTDKKIKELSKKYPNLFIKNDGIEAKAFINLLFINRGGYYSCFIEKDIENNFPLFEKETKWDFTTNHDSCWRTSAFDDANKILSEIKDSIFEISKEKDTKVKNVLIPKHILPNFANVKNSEIFMFDELSTNESYNEREHVLKNNKSNRTFKSINKLV